MQKIKFYPVGNGDSVLIKSDNHAILTDIHYRSNADNDDESEYDIATDLLNECGNSISVFINTHPDKDHILGFESIFHTGTPSKFKENSDLLLVEEIWVTPYVLNITDPTDQSKAFVEEVRRRDALNDDKDGNRLKIISVDDANETQGQFGDTLSWMALSPIDEYCELAEDDDSERNNTSIVIRWNFSKGENSFAVLLGGDAEKEVWERINKDCTDDELSWNCLLAPHHCSSSTFGNKNDDEEYEIVEDAKSAISHVIGNGWIISSSKKPEDNDDNPPSWWARSEYIKILNNIEEKGEERFLNPETYGENERPEPIVFVMDDDGNMLLETYTEKTIAKSQVFAKPQKYGAS